MLRDSGPAPHARADGARGRALRDAVGPAARPRTSSSRTSSRSPNRCTRSTIVLRHDGVTLSRGGPVRPGFLRMHEPYTGPYGESHPRPCRSCRARRRRSRSPAAPSTTCASTSSAPATGDHDEFLARRRSDGDRRTPDPRPPLDPAAHLPVHRGAGAALRARSASTSRPACRSRGGRATCSSSASASTCWTDLIPLKRLLDAGLPVACGSDWGPKNIFEHVALAETHEFCGSGRRNDDAGAARVARRGAR